MPRLLASALSLCLFAPAAWPQDPAKTGGVLKAIDGGSLTVAPDRGDTLKLKITSRSKFYVWVEKPFRNAYGPTTLQTIEPIDPEELEPGQRVTVYWREATRALVTLHLHPGKKAEPESRNPKKKAG
jgi:hypothetical protein